MKHFLAACELSRLSEHHKHLRVILADAQPFVMTPDFCTLSEMTSDKDKIHAPPFPVFFIEMTEGGIFPNELNDAEIRGLLIKEVGPNDYENYLFAAFPDGTCSMTSDITMPPELQRKNFNLVQHFLKRLEESQLGVLNVRKPIKLGKVNGKKIIKRLKNVIYIRPKTSNFQPEGFADIQWTHSWLVRGHWRKVNGIGKDREGKYCVNGYTYVTPHKKGNGDLVKKTRLVN